MASVTSLDKDLRKMRLDKYTPAAANEARQWIESVLGERLPSGDLLEGLKDGVALCKLVNFAVPPPGIKYKQSAMPFVQMENISHFLRACQAPPLNLQEHDMFLTVDLYEAKDPAQVLQCLGAFSRAANSVNPANFPHPIGPRRGGAVTPQSTGPATPTGAGTGARGRGISNASNASSVYGTRTPLGASKTGDSGSGRWSPTKSPTSNGAKSPSVSSWSKREHEGATAPAWNIAQYGYMGGASQGNLGIAFGGRRQITTAAPHVPNVAEKERRRRDKEAEEERQRQQMEEEERRRRAEREAEEERARLEEERRWEEETRRLREEEARRAAEEKRRWEEEERQWRETEEKRRREEEEAEERLAQERQRSRSKSDARLRGQLLSQYQAEHGLAPEGAGGDGYSSRVKELERELEQARQREAEYERERQQPPQARAQAGDPKARARSRSRAPSRPPRSLSRQESWTRNEREHLQTQWRQQQQDAAAAAAAAPPPPPRPLPDPAAVASPPGRVKAHRTGEAAPKVVSHNTGSSRPLPDPAVYASPTSPPPAKQQRQQLHSSPLPAPPQQEPSLPTSRTDKYLASHPAPAPQAAKPTYSRELGATAERDAEDRRRQQAQQATRAGGSASKSLLEREMEMERQRQREWEEAQQETARAAAARPAGAGDAGVDGIGGGVGGRWDVGQWAGYTGGDSQNRGAQGIGAGRRQIVGPRPLPGPGR